MGISKVVSISYLVCGRNFSQYMMFLFKLQIFNIKNNLHKKSTHSQIVICDEWI